MERLFTVAFDNLAHSSPTKAGKGLRQIEGLLAQICLSTSLPLSQSASHSTRLRSLEELAEDLAFREFFRLQEGFEWNVATRLVECLERLLSMGKASQQTDTLILSALTLLQGILLLHPPSRILFGRERNMTLLLDLLTPTFTSSIILTTLHILVCALLDTPRNTRTFEKCEGLATVTALFKNGSAGGVKGGIQLTQELKLKVVEFFYFYLMPETPSNLNRAHQAPSEPSDRSGKILQDLPILASSTQSAVTASAPSSQGKDGSRDRSEVRALTEKQILLSRYLGHAEVEGLVQDLQESLTGTAGGVAIA